MYLLRTIDPTHHLSLWSKFDDLIRDTLTHILGSAVDEQGWAQAQLPVSMGGLGLRSADDHSAGVYISSVNASENLKAGLLPQGSVTIDLTPAMTQLSAKLEEED